MSHLRSVPDLPPALAAEIRIVRCPSCRIPMRSHAGYVDGELMLTWRCGTHGSFVPVGDEFEVVSGE